MIPENRLSTTVLFDPIVLPVAKEPSELVSNEYGGVALNDPTEGLMVRVWQATVEKSGDPLVKDDVYVAAEGIAPAWILDGYDITEVSLAFDQNSRPTITFVESGQAKLYWYDSLVEQPVITTLAAGVTSPRCTLDDHRDTQLGSSDILLVYVRDGNLYFRQQRDRYLVERLLYPDINTVMPDPRVDYVAMNINWRVQIKMRGNFYGG